MAQKNKSDGLMTSLTTTILGEIEIPQGATAEQVAHVQKIVDTFFGRQESWVWIDKYSRFTSTTPKQTIFAVVMVDGGKK